MTPTLDTPTRDDLNSPQMHRRVNSLRTIDNWTNWLYLVRECLWPALTVGLTIAFYQYREEWGLAWAWNVPVTLLAVVIVGACQHRLSNLAHEASHYMLFRNRLLNELVSDLFCMFPMWSTTHAYRLQHLAHHQYVNDPERDPDQTQMRASGHKFYFPMAARQFLWHAVFKQLIWVPNLIRYIRVRAKYANVGSGASGPYQMKGPRSRILLGMGMVYVAVLAATLCGLVLLGNPWLLALVPLGLLTAIVTFYALVPERLYQKPIVKSDIRPRWHSCLRVAYMTGLLWSIAWLTYVTEQPWWLYYFLLWLVPIGTTFSFFMILRQVVQHGNASQDRLTNTRIFHVGKLIQWSVFPLGMDYHLPHHMFPMVPHYRLRQLHELLLETEAYRQHAVVVEGYFFPPEQPPKQPTVLDLMAREIGE
jgi:fatty acid desaturase